MFVMFKDLFIELEALMNPLDFLLAGLKLQNLVTNI